jgi:glycosidase
MRRIAVGGALGLLVAAACTTPTSSTTSTSIPTIAPATTTAAATTTTAPTDPGIIAPMVHNPAEADVIYFVMTDRFANGDPSNDTGGIEGGPLQHGFLPTDEGFYHGGDIPGLISKLDYIQDLGANALWITPPFTNRTVQGGGTLANSSAGYHGYWQIDLTRLDPHLGADAVGGRGGDLNALVEAAHQRGMKVYLDAVTNHTGDVITYAGGAFGYRPKNAYPYLDAAGAPFDDADFADVVDFDDFPELAATSSFPYTPSFADAADATIKAPDFLNDVTNYHNRGNSSFSGENSLYGDFFGLDDLFTEKPIVVAGMLGIYGGIVKTYDVDGFRVDTVKHVNDEFWEQWVPEILEEKDGLFMFGEVAGESPPFRSRYTTELPFPSVLDWGFNDAATAFGANGLGASVFANHFESDDWFTDADSNAHQLVKFTGNHDMGRIGAAIAGANPGAGDEELVERSRLIAASLFLTRGIPVVYYGDEQGFTGGGGDKAARQDMFPSLTEIYIDDDQIGTEATPGDDNFDPTHPLYRATAELAGLRSQHPTFASGAQFTRLADEGVFAFSRIDDVEQLEYLVVLSNNEGRPVVTFDVATPNATFRPLIGDDEVASDGTSITMSVPSLSVQAFVADRPLPRPAAAPSIRITRPHAAAVVELPRFLVEGEVSVAGYVEVTFAVVIDGITTVLGTDDSPPYRVPWNTDGLDPGTEVEIVATAVDAAAQVGVARATVTIGG